MALPLITSVIFTARSTPQLMQSSCLITTNIKSNPTITKITQETQLMTNQPKHPRTTQEDAPRYYCEQCGQPMNPIDFILGPICRQCCKFNHAAAACQPALIKHQNRINRHRRQLRRSTESGQAMILFSLVGIILIGLALIGIFTAAGYPPTLPPEIQTLIFF